MILGLVLALRFGSGQALATQAADTSNAARRVDGRVVRGTREGPVPIADRWVVLHRVGRDRSGPVDSTRTTRNGYFTIRYRASGDTAAIYFVTTSYDGIVYPSSPLRAAVVSGDDAMITVFDTTSGPVAIKLGGRHVIIGAPQPNGRRPVGEVYDLENDSTVTVIARDSLTPVWTAHIPDGAVGFQVNTNGDLAGSAVARRGASVGLFAPLSPGIRQLAFTYELPAAAFPLSIPSERPVGVLELLVQEPTASVGVSGRAGTPLREVAPASTDGRTFRRFLAQDLAATAIIRIDMPRVSGIERERVYVGVGTAILAAMGIALVFAARRGAPRRVLVGAVEPQSRVLVRAIARLDDEFDRAASTDVARRATYETTRALLKQELGEALAAERRAP